MSFAEMFFGLDVFEPRGLDFYGLRGYIFILSFPYNTKSTINLTPIT